MDFDLKDLHQTIEKTKKTAFFVNYNDVERWICKRFEFKEYCIPALHEQGNDTDLSINVTAEEMDAHTKKEVKKYIGKDCGVHWSTRSLLSQMCFEGLIPKGEYVISISW